MRLSREGSGGCAIHYYLIVLALGGHGDKRGGRKVASYKRNFVRSKVSLSQILFDFCWAIFFWHFLELLRAKCAIRFASIVAMNPV